jgi:phosphinothricin acetyltransferase
MQTAVVRTARRRDCPAINEIHNFYVANTTATFLLEPQTLDERHDWFDGRSAAHPVLVAELERRVVGWASLSAFRARPAYARTAEVGVYVHHDFHRRGIGRILIDAIVERGRDAGLHVIVGGACSESTASLGLLQACGFQRVAHFHQVGFKFGRWLDVIFLERILTSR